MSEVVVIDSEKPESKKTRRWLWGLLSLIILIGLSIGGFVVWALYPPGLELGDQIDPAITSDDNLTVSDRAWLAFLPHTPPEVGLILYPGGRIPSVAYAPLAREIAEDGYLVVVAYAPLNISLFAPDAATGIIEHFSGVDSWVIGGHSLGGSTATNYAANYPERVSGLVLLGAYPVNDQLASSSLPTLSIYGTNDAFVTTDEIEASQSDLPATAQFVAIEGGNHSQFGYYGTQPNDNEASIAHDMQIRLTTNAIVSFLNQLKTPSN